MECGWGKVQAALAYQRTMQQCLASEAAALTSGPQPASTPAPHTTLGLSSSHTHTRPHAVPLSNATRFGWYGFNVGSVYLYTASSGAAASRVTMNTTLSASSGGLVALAVASIVSGTYDLRIACNGELSGLAIITPMCGYVAPWASVVCGSIAGAVYLAHSRLMLRMHVDDPLDSAAVHYGNGALGMLLLAFVAQPEYVKEMTGTECGGVFFTSSGWLQLGMQVCGICGEGAWAAAGCILAVDPGCIPTTPNTPAAHPPTPLTSLSGAGRDGGGGIHHAVSGGSVLCAAPHRHAAC